MPALGLSLTSLLGHTELRVCDLGALSGGGYYTDMSMSADGGTFIMVYDGNNSFMWEPSQSKWVNIVSQDRVADIWPYWGNPSLFDNGTGGLHLYSVAVAPSDKNTVYATVGSYDGSESWIWKSTDRCTTWVDTGFKLPIYNAHGPLPSIAVDPANPLVVYVSDDAGAIHYTDDGFATRVILNATGQALASVLPSATTTAGTSAGAKVITVASVPTGASQSGLWTNVYASDVSRGTGITASNPILNFTMPMSSTKAGGSTTVTTDYLDATVATGWSVGVTLDSGSIHWTTVNGAPVGTTITLTDALPSTASAGNTVYARACTSTTITMGYNLPSGAAIVSGDKIVFGGRASIVFDPSSSVVGGKTQGIYIGWNYGASAVYHSTNGGTSFSAVTAGTPPSKVARLAITPSGVLFAIDNNLPVSATNVWRYQSGSWSNLSVSAPGTSNIWGAVACDQLNDGRVALAAWAGNLQMSGDNGATWWTGPSSYGSAANHLVATDVPWLETTNENWQSVGQLLFDTVTSGKLWFTEGIGIWYSSPSPNGGAAAPTVTYTSQNLNAQSLICDHIIKPPGQALMIAAQDRVGIRLPSLTTEPSNDFGIQATLGGGVHHSHAIDYAKDYPNVVACVVNTNLWVSGDGGVTWTRRLAQPASTVNGQGCIALQNSSNSINSINLVWFPVNGTPAYTTDGGQSWTNCTFNNPGTADGWSWIRYLNRKLACADLVNSNTFYCYSYNNNATGGIWRSTDGGATWSNVSGGVIANVAHQAATDFNLNAVPENEGHLLIGAGTGANGGDPLKWSRDGGATWSSVPGTGICWLASAGAAAPGRSYPAVYFVGTCTTDPNPNDPGVFRANDLDPNTPTAMPSWVRMSRAPGGNMDTPKSIFADLETYGTWYMAFGGTGYSYGRLY